MGPSRFLGLGVAQGRHYPVGERLRSPRKGWERNQVASSPSTGYVTRRQGTSTLVEQLFTARILRSRSEVKEAHKLPHALEGSLRGVNGI